MNSFINIAIASSLATLGAALGFYLVLWQAQWINRRASSLISFAAGVLLATALGRLLPEAVSLSHLAFWAALGVFVLFYILEHLLIIHSCQEEECQVHHLGLLSFLGIGFHGFIDGVIIGAGFEASFALGLLAAISVIAHKLSDGISLMAILLHTGYQRSQALLYSWLVALITPVGAVLALVVLKNIQVTTAIVGVLLGGAAGSFLYIAAADLIPEIHKKSHLGNLFWMLAGCMLPILVAKFLG